MAVKNPPEGYSAVTPYLIIGGAAQAIEFYKEVFGATELMRMPTPNGGVGHAEIQIGDARIMLADEHQELGFRGPKSIGGAAVSIVLYVDDVDAVFKKALAKGAREMQKVEDKFYGDRMGTLEDPWGHVWSIGTHKEDVSPEEMEKRARAQGA